MQGTRSISSRGGDLFDLNPMARPGDENTVDATGFDESWGPSGVCGDRLPTVHLRVRRAREERTTEFAFRPQSGLFL